MNAFHLEVLASDGAFYRGECISLTVPTPDGLRGFLPHHSNLISAVTPGRASFVDPDGIRHEFLVDSGLLKVEAGDILLLVDTAERPEDAEANRTRRETERAREQELARKSLLEYQAAQAALSRAIRQMRGGSEYETT